MRHASATIAVALLTITSAFGQSNAAYQQRAGSSTQHKDGSTSEAHANAGLKEEAGIEAGFFMGNDKTNEKTIGRNRDEKWFLGIRGSARAGAAVDAGASHTENIGGTDVRTYVEGEAFVGVEADAQAGVSPPDRLVKWPLSTNWYRVASSSCNTGLSHLPHLSVVTSMIGSSRTLIVRPVGWHPRKTSKTS